MRLQEMSRGVGILVFDGVEELDFVGPLEVFGMAGRLKPGTFEVFTLGSDGEQVHGTYGLKVKPDYSFKKSPDLDILVVPGGRGARREMKNRGTLEFVTNAARSCELVTSVCTGALVLASAGLLDGKRATTHWAALDELRAFKGVSVEHRRYIRQGNIITSGGISSGIDMSLHVVGMLCGARLKSQTAKRMEYRPRGPI